MARRRWYCLSVQLTLYSKPGCHLCDDAKAKIGRLRARGFDLSLEERDITTNREWFERFRETIPVIELPDGRSIEAPISEFRLERLLHGDR